VRSPQPLSIAGVITFKGITPGETSDLRRQMHALAVADTVQVMAGSFD